MSILDDLLDDVRATVAPSDKTLSAARKRRDHVLAVARRFPGALRTYCSGSIAHGTANDDTDADCGVVLDRRSYTALGPDGEGEGPGDVVEEMRTLLRDELRDVYPDIAFRITKRAIKITFNQPLLSGCDPSVDLIVALTRVSEGLWIPNMKRPGWDASDPERHTELLVDEPKSRRVTRARVVRLAKAWNGQSAKKGLASFNIEVLALRCVEKGVGVSRSLAGFFDYASRDLAERLTPDPAGISGPIKLLLDRDVVVGRLQRAADLMERALADPDDAEAVRDALADLSPKLLLPPEGGESKAAFAAAARSGRLGFSSTAGLVVGTGPLIKPTRAFGRGT